MCKNLFMIGINNVPNALLFTSTMAAIMSRKDDDGIGYSAFDSSGNMFSEKWLHNRMFTIGNLSDDSFLKKVSPFVKDGWNSDTYSSFGTKKWEDLRTITLHTRKACSKVCIENTHPFIIDDVSLVHNGVITNHLEYPKTISSCDTEVILSNYLLKKVSEDHNNFQGLASMLAGWYACGVLHKVNNKPTIDVFRQGANLFVANIPEIGGYIFCTSDDYIREGAAKCKFDSPDIYEMNNNTFVRFDAMTAEITQMQTFFPKVTQLPANRSTTGNYSTIPQRGYTQNSTNSTPSIVNTTAASSGGSESKLAAEYLNDTDDEIYIVGKFTQSMCDKLECVYDAMFKWEQDIVDKLNLEERYEVLTKYKSGERLAV